MNPIQLLGSSKKLRVGIYWIGGDYLAIAVTVLMLRAYEVSFSTLKYRKDFTQDYLLARAARDGLPPYEPLPKLKLHLLPEDKETPIFPHPSPHPPTLIPFIYPLAFVSYERATVIWFCVGILAAFFSSKELVRFIPLEKPPPGWVVFLALLGAPPVYKDLMLGQLNLFLLLGALFMIRLREKQFNFGAGICLGLLLSIKLSGVPILLYFFLKREWKALFGAALTFGLLSVIASALIGFSPFLSYFLTIALQVGKSYIVDPENQSIWSLAHRLFIGVKPVIMSGPTVKPLFDLPWLAVLTGTLLTVGITLGSVFVALRSRREQLGLSVLTGVSAIIAQIVWSHGFVLLFLPLFSALKTARELSFSPYVISAGAILLGLLYIGDLFTAPLFIKGTLYFRSPLPTIFPMIVALSAIGYSLFILRATSRAKDGTFV